MELVKQEPKSPNSTNEDGLALTDVSENRCAVAVCAWAEERLYGNIKCKCDAFREEIEPRVIYDFEIKINAMDLLDFNASVGNLLIKDTRKFMLKLQWAIFNLIGRYHWLNLSNSSQVLIIPRVTNLPTFSGDEIKGGLGCVEKLVKIFGTIVSITPVLQYTKGTKYNCTQQDCQSFTGDDDVVAWLPGSSESSLVRLDSQCRICSSIMREAVQFRKIGEKRIVKLILEDGISCLQACSTKKYARHQAVAVILRDDLTTRIDIGHQYWITGMVVVDAINRVTPQQFYIASLEAFDIEEARAATIGKYLADEELPATIQKLYEDRALSPWSFVASLAYCFGDSISIGGSYHKLKLALLLSLVLTGDDVFIEDIDGKLVIGSDLNKVNILAASEDILTIQRLFAYASTFCERSILNQSCLELFGSTNKHSNFDGTFFVDGGSLLLAGRHVCIIPNVSVLKKDDSEKLQKSLEETSICLNIPKRAADQSDFTQISFPLKCTVWAATESSPTTKETSTFDLAYDFCGEYRLPEEIDDDNVNEMLRRSIGVDDEMEVSYEDLLQFIRFARSQRVSFDEDASTFLKSFFLASRRARNSGFVGAEIGKRALQTMLALAAAHAKLALRKQVTIDDALVAIILYEESLIMKSGQSVIDLSPAMHFSRANFAAHLGPKNDDWMRMLQAQISVFCRTYSTGMDLFRPEE